MGGQSGLHDYIQGGQYRRTSIAAQCLFQGKRAVHRTRLGSDSGYQWGRPSAFQVHDLAAGRV
ncbi:MAG: hypothetical protein JTJ26_12665 [Prevotella sp.]|nr:hypothetical protein [Prevotella sp.]